MLLSGQLQNTSWRSHDNVWGLSALQELDVGLHRGATVHDFSADVLHELGESVELSLDLVSELASVAKDQAGAGLWVLLQALQDRQHEDGGLAHTRDGLAEHINTED